MTRRAVDHFAGVINRPGCFAEYTAVDERLVALKPSSLGHEDAAAVPLTVRALRSPVLFSGVLNGRHCVQALTAWEMLAEGFSIPIPADVGDEAVNQNKTLLVLGGAGGVGSIALQIAKHVHAQYIKYQLSCIFVYCFLACVAGAEDRPSDCFGVATRDDRLVQEAWRRRYHQPSQSAGPGARQAGPHGASSLRAGAPKPD
jgi:hypothetical protein